MSGVERARARVRELTPLLFNFDLPIMPSYQVNNSIRIYVMCNVIILLLVCPGHQQPLHAGHYGPVQRPDHPPAQAEELSRHDSRGQGLRVGVCQGQGGDTPAHGTSLQGMFSISYKLRNDYLKTIQICEQIASWLVPDMFEIIFEIFSLEQWEWR